MIDPHVAMDKLASLGCADDVAEYLIAERITGGHSAASCPVAMYMRRESGLPVWIAHSVWGSAQPTRGLRGEPLPAPVKDFVRLYDNDGWPQLRNDEVSE